MAEVRVLIEGYAKESDRKWSASSSTVLIKDKKVNVIVDPGTNRKRLLLALKKERLKPEDIDFVIMTHYHIDHNFLAAMFSKAKILDNTDIYFNDKSTGHDGYVPRTGIKIISTPGHAKEHCSVAVKMDKGTIVVAGDVFWWRDNEKQDTNYQALLNKEDPYVKDQEKLLESRKNILEIADFIIPGHGKMFKVKK